MIDFEMGRNNLPIAFVFCFFSFPQLHLSLHYHFFFVLYFSLFLFYLFIYFFQKQLSISFRVCCPTLFDGHTYIIYKRVRKKICYWLTMVSRGCGGIKKKKGGTARRKSNEKKTCVISHAIRNNLGWHLCVVKRQQSLSPLSLYTQQTYNAL